MGRHAKETWSGTTAVTAAGASFSDIFLHPSPIPSLLATYTLFKLRRQKLFPLPLFLFLNVHLILISYFSSFFFLDCLTHIPFPQLLTLSPNFRFMYLFFQKHPSSPLYLRLLPLATYTASNSTLRCSSFSLFPLLCPSKSFLLLLISTLLIPYYTHILNLPNAYTHVTVRYFFLVPFSSFFFFLNLLHYITT